jgi:isopenicillin N synthase-like dioxygenase
MIAAEEVAPPPEPPPILSVEEVKLLAKQGWIAMPSNPSLIEEYTALSKSVATFFDKDREEKAKTYPKAEGTELGYYHVENEKEYVTLRSTVHPDSDLEKRAANIWQDTAAILQRIMLDLARGLDGPVDIWDSLLDGCLTLPEKQEDITPSLLRLFRYFPGSGFAAQHVDLGFLTLCVGDSRGLQVLDRNTNEWIDAPGPTILVGETLRVLTGGMMQAGEHRVVENSNGRSSIVFALRPSLRHDIDLGNFGGDGIVASKELWDKIYKSKFNINATKDVRERQRKNLEAKRPKDDSVKRV